MPTRRPSPHQPPTQPLRSRSALALLHHMMYQQARQAFEQITEQHPECGVAHWGVAMTLFQPLWPARPDAGARQRGWDALQRAKEHGALTDRERALVAAAEAFFQRSEVDEWWPRIRRWSDAIEEAYRERPDDAETDRPGVQEARAFGKTDLPRKEVP